MRRSWAAGAALAAVAGSLIVGSSPAEALSCRVPKLDEILERGYRVAVVTRVGDANGGTDRFRVLAQIGEDLPEKLEVPSSPMGGQQVLTDGVAATAFQGGNGRWSEVICAHLDLGEVLARIDGKPKAVEGGTPVAYAAGGYGGSRVVALDATGNTVAWDGKSGTGTAIASCPGGTSVVSVGRRSGPYEENRRLELTVHDSRTLAVKRTVELPAISVPETLALRCANVDATSVDVLFSDHGPSAGTRFFTVTSDGTVERELGALASPDKFDGSVAVLPTGYLLASEHGKTAALTLIDFQGRTQRTIELESKPFEVQVSPDGRTAAYYAADLDVRRLTTLDLAREKVLGTWQAREHVTGFGWTADGDLLVRNGSGSGEADPDLIRVDRSLRELDRGVAGPGWKFAVVGDQAVNFDDARMSAGGTDGATDLPDLRLAATNAVVAAASGGFELEREEAAAGDGGSGVVVASENEESPKAAAVGGAAAGAAALGLGLFWRRRRAGTGNRTI
ncbi:MAG: YncE family protein [Sporichthyaceae bacterium]